MTGITPTVIKAATPARTIRTDFILWGVWFAVAIASGVHLFANARGAFGGFIIALGPLMLARLWKRDRFVARRMLVMCLVGLVFLLVMAFIMPAHLSDLGR